MTEVDRQRRLHVENRLEELRRKHGADLEAEALPAWLDTYEGFLQSRSAVDQPISPAPMSALPSRVYGRAVSGGRHQSAVNSGPALPKPSADFSDLDV